MAVSDHGAAAILASSSSFSLLSSSSLLSGAKLEDSGFGPANVLDEFWCLSGENFICTVRTQLSELGSASCTLAP